ncbi:unnamed protein product [Medioppia subpectinata]|uniref:MAM domain-containing protein n=1 Tax=Medioppia subpectinata TaxID=1979941 RepID=A0A7R9KGW2_9ACAR|nr:unnamed protein product [Medioppia subpectinata]CAG2103134.1 unnamed protein product [Medioppia subpectinata]
MLETQSVGRQVSSRDWPEDGPEYEIINPDKPETPVKPSTPVKPVRPVRPTARPDRSPGADWSCEFDRNDCGVINDQIVGNYFKLRSNQMRPLLGQTNYLWLNITDTTSMSSGARLITPYFPTKNYPKGCLSIDYMMRGNGMKEMIVYQQEGENRCLWSYSSHETSGDSIGTTTEMWHKLSLGVDLTAGSPRFFVETHFDNRPPNVGSLAISRIQFTCNECQQNSANNCGHKPVVNDESDSSTDDYQNDFP